MPRALKLTYEDYAALPLADGRRYEILDGELYMTPSPLIRHQAVSRNLQRILDHHILENELGELFDAPVDLILARTTITVPDLVFVRGDRKSIITEKAIEGAPDVVVEIVSPSSRKQDLVIKARLYSRYRVREYWIVDPDARTLDVLELRGRAYHRAARFAGAVKARSKMFPGLEIDLGKVWA
ncbi:MAG TPA: Uma2 family endonuclease [Candidatus Binatia bacterium]|nr:Uma2 family endonuclease [Candidatus Binatia bacterium]